MNDLADKLKDIIKDIFPNSYLECYYSTQFCSSITIRFALGKDNTEWKNGIIQNDPAFNVISIYSEKDGYQANASCIGLRDKVTYKTDKLGWRDIKKGVTEEKLVKHIAKYFYTLYSSVKMDLHYSVKEK